MIPHITAAAPRMLLRLFVLEELLERHPDLSTGALRAGEIGPGLGDAASYVAATLELASFDLHEASDKARRILDTRFADDPRIRTHGRFEPRTGHYDLLLCFEVVEHVEDDTGLLGSIGDSLAPGGTFIGSVPAYARKWQSVDELAGHCRRYEPREMSAKLAAAGLDDIEIETYGFPLINLLYPVRELYYSRQLRARAHDSREAATLRSGTARGLARSVDSSAVYRVARLFDRLRSLPGTSRFDDGLVFFCRKRR